MSSISLGAGSAVGIGEESTHGTGVAISNWFAVSSWTGGEVTYETVASARLYDGVTDRESYEDTKRVGALVLTGELHYEGLGWLFKHAMGSVSTSGTASPYTHTYTMALDLPTGLTVEPVPGNATNSETFKGGIITQIELSGAHGQPIIWTATINCQDAATRAAKSTPTAPTYDPILSSHLDSSKFAWNSRTITPLSWRLTLSNNMDVEIGRIGSQLRDCPVRAGRAEVTLTLEVPYEDDDNLYNDFLAKTAADLAANITKGATDILNVKLANAKLLSVVRPVSTVAKQVQTLVFQGFSDASEEALTITITNTQSSGLD